MTPLCLDAPAKLNLRLAVVGRRADGYHELVTDMALLELADRLLLLPGGNGLRVERLADDGGDVPVTPSENLAWRGMVAGFGGEPEAWCLALEKRIPAAAGLGGGSSDAAAGWRLARHATGQPPTAKPAEMATLAAIGADVPFFAAGLPAARVTGMGENVEAIEPPGRDQQVVLAHPPFALSTAAVYAEVQPGEWSRDPATATNDLLPAALRLRPELGDAMRLMAGAGLAPRVTGSGPTIFGTTDEPDRAEAVARRLARGGLRASVTRFRSQAASIEPVEDGSEVE